MKKLPALILAFGFLGIQLTACQATDAPSQGQESAPALSLAEENQSSAQNADEIPTLHMVIDLNRTSLTSASVTNFLATVPGFEREFKVTTETIPRMETEIVDGFDKPIPNPQRETTLTRLRTELMAGAGPDLFFCQNSVVEGYEGLFPFPQRAMANQLFLPLDDYIANQSNRMDFDKLIPAVMEAGRNDEGQQIMPISFSFYTTLFDRSKYTLSAQLPMSWDQALACDDPMVRFAQHDWYSSLGHLAKGDQDILAVTEEEIVQRYQDGQKHDYEDFPEFTQYSEEYKTNILVDDGSVKSIEMGCTALGMVQVYGANLNTEQEYWMVPSYNMEGGITAMVDGFMAINRNSQYPEYSFRIIDSMLGDRGQSSGIMQNMGGMPVLTEVGLDGTPGPGYSMNQWNSQQYREIIKQINLARFWTPLEYQLNHISFDMYWEDPNLEETVHKYYMKMQMLLAES